MDSHFIVLGSSMFGVYRSAFYP